jgi:ketosteroid isomerase-like protein
MSQQNVEIVKRLTVAFNERDVAAFATLTTLDFEWTTAMTAVEGEVFLGRGGVETWFGRMRDSWEEFKAIPDEIRDLGDRVLWHGRLDGRGLLSGVPVTAPLDILCHLRGGKVARMHSFLDHDEALRAAGLTE